MSEKKIGEILETSEYAKFKFSATNRPIDRIHVGRLKKMIQKGEELNPINVNNKGIVQDGQHRYMAWKECNKPIRYFIGKNLTPEQIAEMNNTTKKWGNDDFANTFAKQGNENYRTYRVFRTQFPDIPHACALAILSNETSRSTVMERQFRVGGFVIQNQTKANKVAKSLMEMKPLTKVYSRMGFILAILYLTETKGFDMERMIRKLKHKGAGILDLAQRDDFIRELEKIYNWMEPADKKMRLFNVL